MHFPYEKSVENPVEKLAFLLITCLFGKLPFLTSLQIAAGIYVRSLTVSGGFWPRDSR